MLCVTSASWLATAYVPQMLAGAGAKVTFLGPASAWPLRGRFVSQRFLVEGTPQETAEALRKHLASTRPYDWVIVGDDHLLAALASRSHEEWVQRVLPVPTVGSEVGLLGSKVGFVRAAAALGLPIPPSRVCENEAELRSAAATIGYPVILKREGPSGGEGCLMLTDNAALESAAATLAAGPFVVQRFVDGPTFSVDVLFDRGHARVVLTSRIDRCWPPPYGVSAQRSFFLIPALVRMAEQLGEAAGLHGFANVTAVRESNAERYWLIEADPRPNALIHLAPKLGVDLSSELRALLRGSAPGPAHTLATGPATKVALFPADVLRCILAPDPAGLFAWVLNRDRRWRFLPRDDARLLRALAIHLARQVVQSWRSRKFLPSRPPPAL